ncbi:hypothetical protein Ciccas_010131, partial [Cichlidogyrus casuarinus]
MRQLIVILCLLAAAHPVPYGHNYFELKFFNDSSLKCNDGSPAGYYYRAAKNVESRDWLIFLEGGWYCFDKETCFSRHLQHPKLFSSNNWNKRRYLTGILSSEKRLNPVYHEYHN